MEIIIGAACILICSTIAHRNKAPVSYIYSMWETTGQRCAILYKLVIFCWQVMLVGSSKRICQSVTWITGKLGIRYINGTLMRRKSTVFIVVGVGDRGGVVC